MSRDCCGAQPSVGTLFLFHIRQEVNNDYDTYSDAVVVAESEEQARKIHPRYGLSTENRTYWTDREWAEVKDVKASRIGEAYGDFKAGDVICASYHQG